MPVRIQRRRDGCVAHSGLNRFRVYARGNEETCMSVPQIVKPHVW